MTTAERAPAGSAPRVVPARAALHPLAWWAWALGLAVAVGRTTNPLVLGLLLAVVVLVVMACRDDSPWARAFGGYLVLGAVIVVMRMGFYVLFGLDGAGPVVLELPSVSLPEWVRGMELLGPVHLYGLLDAAVGGLRLAALVVCFGAANALANPKRALRCLPASLHHLGTAVVVAVTVTPQLVSAVARVRRAQRLRGLDGRGLRPAVALLVPVLQDALDHALELAASMDSRGYARASHPGGDRRVGAALLLALVAAVLGTYGLLDATSPAWMGVPLLSLGGAVAVAASLAAGRRVRRTRYRPDPWRATEALVAGAGALAALIVAVAAAADPGASNPPAGTAQFLALPPAAVLAAACALVPLLMRRSR
ncbi:energy-coupling factor transporter transmembrane protein EcfT [Georgenia yuyongxinii]|uniref:Energy-coupling factor transporter transmembrane protein EcfT n=1 Tax=Georgenia yuyongxinii TaxID=2589797 RepID=A0A5B8C9V7_9MICO|nr:energy-coupling factor transporter transmembrane component T [Georgenia yuyongxinii]QDC26361.1 energy-coupling factor transporter transmembrane protein EcfT [Georgenia yuyongxinii]